ncbi:hypothetical protein PMZ80_007967 [Knufia obscura]|uniref:NAD(P)-binding domain-containing protein n=1 Tax=Knufia obscura TaxID=1635080 RepID=A0ABR0RH69_9EURO|nr:hypothetical protein PMZ80_007967 [Knufia obscura]
MADTLSKVVLVGWDTTRLTRPPSCQQASGTIGTHILHALLEDPADNFEVTILTRPESTSTFPSHPSVTIARVAHDDYDGLTRTFSSHDAIIHAGAIPSIPTQPLLIKAAVAAGIKRFILNEFANSPITQTGLPETARFRQPRLDVLAVAKDAAANNPTFSWTGLAVGNILDLSLLRYPQFGIDVRKHSVKYTDDGTERVSAVILPDIGLAVRGILRAPEGTRNRYCHVRSVETDQVGIVRALEGRQGVRYAGERSGFHDLVVVQLFGRVEGSGGSVIVGREESDNLLLGVREKEVGEVVEGVLRSLEEGDGNAGGSEGKDVLGQARRTMG